MGNVRCIAVDWSGAEAEPDQLAHVWVAVAAAGHLMRLRNGLTRDEVINLLATEIVAGGPLVIGLDFAFSFPQWYLTRHNLNGAHELWDLAAIQGDDWLSGETWPFWGKDKSSFQKRPKTLVPKLEFRQTDLERKIGSRKPKSVFQINGAGSVGAQTIRGLPGLTRLRRAGAAVWPFDVPDPDRPIVIELYPRVLYGRVNNSGGVTGRNSRRQYLERHYPNLVEHWTDIMIGSGDAFDAGVSALVMSANVGNLQGLQQAVVLQRLLEGEIWAPPQQPAGGPGAQK